MNINTILTIALNGPMLLMIIKMYGDWRIIKNRIDMMWKDYCKEHQITDIEPNLFV